MPDDDKPPSWRWGFRILAVTGLAGVLAGFTAIGAANASTVGSVVPRSTEWTGFILLGAIAIVGIFGSILEKKTKIVGG